MALRNFTLAISFATLIVLASCSKEQVRTNPAPEQQAVTAQTVPIFDGARAFALLESQVAFGPRVFGTTAHDECLRFLMDTLAKYADHVDALPFDQPTYEGGTQHLTNVFATIGAEKVQRVFLCAHWDSRPRADEEKDVANQSKPIPGANDGASGVAILLEIARLLKANPPPIGVDIAFFDGEDYGTSSDIDKFCLGSKYFSKFLPPGFHSQKGILLDLVGDKEAVFKQDAASIYYARDVVNAVWAAAKRANAKSFIDAPGPEIMDDHIALNDIGVRTIDIIDAELVGNRSPNPRRRYWHTLGDTPENCSAAMLSEVGSTLLQYIYAEPATP